MLRATLAFLAVGIAVIAVGRMAVFGQHWEALAAQPTPMVSVTTLPALPSSAPSAGPASPVTPAGSMTAAPAGNVTMSPQDAAAHAVIQVTGQVSRPMLLTLKDLEHMRKASLTLRVRDADGRQRVHSFTGVLLSDVIARAYPTFPNDSATLAHKFVVVTGVNGASAVVGFPEFVPDFNGKKIILAYLVDFQNVTAPGFALLVVPEDATRMRFLSVATLSIGDAAP